MKENKDVLKLLQDRYFLSNEKTWEDVAIRVGKIYEPITEYIKNMEFIPSTPTLFNANTNGERLGTLSSCFPMGIEDSIESIFNSLHECALVTKASGGIGLDVSILRSSKEEVKGIGKRYSSGPLPFVNIFNSMLDGVSQGGSRRGAGMCQLDITHPDILDFIEAKNDTTQFTRFNFSVRITEDFYKKLEKTPNDIHKVYIKTKDKWVDLEDNKRNKVTIKQLWDKIIHQAWKSAEPGIFNSDIAYRQCTHTNVNNHVLSNPCLPDYVELITDKGIKQLKDINIGDMIWSKEGWTKIINKWSSGIKKVYEYNVNGMSLFCTKDHKIVSNNKKIKAEEAKNFDIFDVDLVGYIKNKDNFENNCTKKTSNFNLLFSSYKETIEVFDITVDNGSHTFWCNGFNISNCQEHISIPYSSCNLGSINLSKFINENKEFEWERYTELVKEATIFLDKVIDVNNFPIEKIKEVTLRIRPIGLGTMGFAHALYKMSIPYNSKKAIDFTEELYNYTTLCSMQQSIELSKQQNISYPAFDYDLYVSANKRFFKRKKVRNIIIDDILKDLKKYGIKNATQTSVAPTGSISFIANTSSGIEPVFALAYERKIEKEGKKYDSVFINDPVFNDYLDINFDINTKQKILEYVLNNKGSVQGCKDISNKMQRIFLVANDLKPNEHLDILEKVNNGTSMSVSKTINLPSNVTEEEVSNIYKEINKRNIIGCTIYREGSRDSILTTNNGNGKIIERNAPKRPKELPCHVYRITVHGEKWIVFVGLYKDHPYEVFSGKVEVIEIPLNIENGIIVKKKSGSYFFEKDEWKINITSAFSSGVHDALTRQVSTNLRHGTPIDYVIEQLEKSHGTVVDFNKSIVRGLRRYKKDKKAGKCPKCSSDLRYVDGCVECSAKCGWVGGCG